VGELFATRGTFEILKVKQLLLIAYKFITLSLSGSGPKGARFFAMMT